MACDGHGTTITFGTSAFSASLLDVTPHSYERGPIDDSHMGTTNAMTFCPNSLYDPGTMEMTIIYNGTIAPPLNGALETVVVDVAGAGASNRVNFSAFLVGFTPSVPRAEQPTATLSWKISGEITIT